MRNNDKKIQILKNAAATKHENTKRCVGEALSEMKKHNIRITFHSVAKYAGVSKTWLYSQAKFREQIMQERDCFDHAGHMIVQKKQVEKKDEQIALLKERVSQLSEEVKELKRQVEIAYGELYKSKE